MDNNCKEYIRDILSVTAIPVSDFNPGTSGWQLTPTVPSSGFSPTLANAIVIGRTPAVVNGAVIPIIRDTGKVDDSESDSVSGRLHTVKVTCDVDTRGAGVYDLLFTLERTPCHLLLTYGDGVTQAFVQATIDTYLCNTERDGSKVSVTLRVKNMMGAQVLV